MSIYTSNSQKIASISRFYTFIYSYVYIIYTINKIKVHTRVLILTLTKFIKVKFIEFVKHMLIREIHAKQIILNINNSLISDLVYSTLRNIFLVM